MLCDCSKPGWCKTHNRHKGLREWEMCANLCPPERPCPKTLRDKYLSYWESNISPGQERIRGAGDVIAAITSAVGIKPCAPCKERRDKLNTLLPFGGNESGLRPDMSVSEMVKLLREPPRTWPSGWAAWPVTRLAHLELLTERLETFEVYPRGKYSGRGIVIGCGGVEYFTQAWVCITLLRHVGCALPIQLWYLGRAEMDSTMIALANSVGVECIDCYEVAKTHPMRILSGWESKIFAIKHCPFEEVLYLDADNVPVQNPEQFFDSDQYTDTGAVFWSDLPPSKRKEWVPLTAWVNIDMEFRQRRAFESGQLLINKRRCWDEVQLAEWINAHSDWYYKFIYGDKDTFLLAWEKLNRRYTMPDRPAGWNKRAILQHNFHGDIAFQHRCQDKWRWDGNNIRIHGFYHEDECFTALTSLRDKWHGVIYHYNDQTPEENHIAESIPGVYRYTRHGLGDRPLELLQNGGIGLGRADCEQWWSLRIFDGVPTLVISGIGAKRTRATMFLTEQSGCWRGKWEYFEQSPVELSRT